MLFFAEGADLGSNFFHSDLALRNRMWSILWSGVDIWKQFKSFSTQSFCAPPIELRAERNKIVPPSCVKRCENICGDSKFAPWKSAIARVI
jgi:hypothetical protein